VTSGVREAVAAVLPALADAPLEFTPFETSNPEWCAGTAIVGGSFVVKFAWSEIAAVRVRREAAVLGVLERVAPGLAVPRIEGTSLDPAAFATPLVRGRPLHLDALAAEDLESVVDELGSFLAGLHDPAVLGEVSAYVPELVTPHPQGTTGALRERLPRFLDERRARLVAPWYDWVDEVLGSPPAERVLVHGDLHGFNQVWSPDGWKLRLVADFEVAGPAEPEYDLRYFPELAHRYPSLDLRRVLAWHIRTALGDALWRSEGGVPLPFGNTPASYVDRIERLLRVSGVYA